MKRLVYILISAAMPSMAMAQSMFAVGELTYSTFDMSEMKRFQADYIQQSGFGGQSVTSFPAYYGFGVKMGRRTSGDKVGYGLALGYTTTGGRVDYEDYSGMARLDQILKAYSAGLFIQRKIFKSEKWPVYGSFTVSWIRTNMTLTETIQAAGNSSVNNVDVHSNNIGFKPSIFVERRLGKIFLTAGAGYEYQITGRMYEGSSQNYLTDSNSGNITAQWTGLRFNAGIGILFQNKDATGL